MKLKARTFGDLRYRTRSMNVNKLKEWLRDFWQHIPESVDRRKFVPAALMWKYSNVKKTDSVDDHSGPSNDRTVDDTNISTDSMNLKNECIKDDLITDTTNEKYDVTNVESVQELESLLNVSNDNKIKYSGLSESEDFSDNNSNFTVTSDDLLSVYSKSDYWTRNNDNLSKGMAKDSNGNKSMGNSEDGILQTLAKVYQLPAAAFLRYRAGGNEPDKIDVKPIIRSDFISRSELMKRTHQLVESLKMATTNISKETRTYELCKHLMQYPDCRAYAVKEGVLPVLLKLRNDNDLVLQSQARQGLALVGYVKPPKGEGVRVLTIDGGGTKGLVAIEALKYIEKSCGRDIDRLFDYVCGVSTGALIAAMVFMYHIPLKECEQIYKDFSCKMFTQNRIVGTGQLVWNHAFYDTTAWQDILRKYIGERLMIDSAKDILCPKISAVSCLTNTPRLTNFIFRNYNLPADALAQFPGNCKHKVWEVIRASSAAPGYYEEFQLGDFVHQDGGLFTNNPTALAIHECRLLWPDESLQCVVSLGNGQYEPNLETISPSRTSLRVKLNKVIDSATDTEAVHTMLQDLMRPGTYYRFNPYMSEEFVLDEIRPEKWQKMTKDAQMYFRKNEAKLKRSATQLTLQRRYAPIIADYLKEKLVK